MVYFRWSHAAWVMWGVHDCGMEIYNCNHEAQITSDLIHRELISLFIKEVDGTEVLF